MKKAETCLLLVPSALAVNENNWLINPQHPEFKQIARESAGAAALRSADVPAGPARDGNIVRGQSSPRHSHSSSIVYPAVSPPFAVGAQPGRVRRLIERAAGETQDGLGGILLACYEDEAVELKEKDARNKTSPLVAVDERMVADDARRIERRHLNHVRMLGIGMMLAGSGQSRLQKTFIAQSRAAAVGG